MAEVRRLDAERLELQFAGGIHAGKGPLRGNLPVPTPLTRPQRTAQALSAETASVLAGSAVEKGN
jgi:glutathione-regulated potassium-efflux system protein KefB